MGFRSTVRSVGRDPDAVIAAEAEQAFTDARVNLTDVFVLPLAGPAPRTAQLAIYWPPDNPPIEEEGLHDAERAALDALAGTHRIGVWRTFALTDLGRAAIAGRLRHEAQHVLQYNEHGGSLCDLDDLLERAQGRRGSILTSVFFAGIAIRRCRASGCRLNASQSDGQRLE